MNSIGEVLQTFLVQAKEGGLKTAHYPKEWNGLKMRVSFGMGAPARVPWIGFVPPEMHIRRGFYPVYLYYKEQEQLILAYGVSETEATEETWPADILNNSTAIKAHFDQDVPRYGDSFVFKAYLVEGDLLKDSNGTDITEADLEADLNTIFDYFKKVISHPVTPGLIQDSSRGLFYMEKQLEDFIIRNWAHTELGKKYDLIIEEGELLSQQYRTEIGPIDILARDKSTGGFVVIELKRDQTSDDTVGQVARYMGWLKKSKGVKEVKGVIIAGQYDKKLDYALSAVPNVEVFLYEVDFKLTKFVE